jgi:hypothetical protein
VSNAAAFCAEKEGCASTCVGDNASEAIKAGEVFTSLKLSYLTYPELIESGAEVIGVSCCHDLIMRLRESGAITRQRLLKT